MKVFITGIAGFLGSHLADALIADGHEVNGIDSLIGGYRNNVPDLAGFIEGDCNQLDLVRDALRGGIDVVVHCAATAYEGLSVFSPHLITQNVLGATASVLSAACDAKVKRFVYLSSMARYGDNIVPFNEDMRPRPQDPYAVNKVAAEQLVRNLCAVHEIEWTIAVPHNIYGPRQKYDDPFRNVASIFANKMLRGEQPIIYGDGMQRRCFSYIDDVVRPLVCMVTEREAVGETINLGPDDDFITIKELALQIAQIIGFELHAQYMPGRPQEVRLASCSADKARALLGYQTTITLETGLRNLVEWIRQRGPRPFDYHLPIEIVNDETPRTWTERLI